MCFVLLPEQPHDDKVCGVPTGVDVAGLELAAAALWADVQDEIVLIVLVGCVDGEHVAAPLEGVEHPIHRDYPANA